MTTPSHEFKLTDTAARQITKVAQGHESRKILRISVDSGGCAGFQYDFKFVQSPHAEDLVFTHQDATVVIDPLSFKFIQNSQLDYVEELIGSYFTIRNPNAQTSCGCGNSFTV